MTKCAECAVDAVIAILVGHSRVRQRIAPLALVDTRQVSEDSPFESERSLPIHLARSSVNPLVGGSIPPGSTICSGS